LVILHKNKKYFGKTDRVNDLKFCTQVIGLALNQREYLSQKIISSAVLSKKKQLSGVPLT
jgi:hypothetical protein